MDKEEFTWEDYYMYAYDCYEDGNYQEALNSLNTIIDCYQLDQENYLHIQNFMSVCFSCLGEYELALDLAKDCYEKRKVLLGENDPDTLMTLSNLANCYGFVGNYKEALVETKKCYELRKKLFGEKDENTINTLNNVAACYQQLGKYDDALLAIEEAYRLYQEVLGRDHPNTLACLNNLGSIYSALGRFDDALKVNKECYELRKELLGETHPQTLLALKNLAACYNILGKYKDGLERSIACYEIEKNSLGKDHPQTLLSLNHLVGFNERLGNFEEAFALGKQAYSLYVDTLGETHPDTLSALNNLGLILGNLERYEESLDMTKKCYEIRKNTLGEKHPETLISLHNLSTCYSDLKQYEKALTTTIECYDLSKEVFGKYHPSTIETLGNLIQDYMNVERYEDALVVARKYLEDSTSLLSNADIIDHEALGNYLRQFKICYRRYIRLLLELDSTDYDYELLAKYKGIIFDIELIQNGNGEYQSIIDKLDEFNLHTIQSKLGNSIVIDFYDREGQYLIYFITKDHIDKLVLKHISELTQYVTSNDVVYICSDGRFMNYPFESLFKDNHVIYLSSIKALMNNSVTMCNQYSLLFADASYGECIQEGDCKPLLGSKMQISIIPRYLDSCRIISQEQFNKDNMCTIIDPNILHISTHGLYEEGLYNIMDQSKLVLSNYNSSNHSADTLITAQELYDHISLKGTQLVYLDACETGLGETIHGEGMYGFRRVMELRGCKYTISTLKTVDDFNATIFSKVFYQHYDELKNIEEAFFETKKYLQSSESIRELLNLEEDLKEVLGPFKSLNTRYQIKVRYDLSKELGGIIRYKYIYDQQENIKEIRSILEDWGYWILQKAG